MKKHMKGFTLVELLAVIVILAIVLIIAVPGVLSIINSTKQKGYESQLKMIKEAARNYVTADSSKISWEDQSDGSKQVVVTLTELQTNGYLDKKLIDPRDKSVITCADVTVKRDVNNKISYDVDATTCKPIDPKCFSFNKETGTIYYYDNSCPKNVKIPSQIDGVAVTSIGEMAFWDQQLTSVVIPDSVTEIGERTFEYNQLKNVVIPNSVITIRDRAFQNNELTSVVIPGTVTTIERSAFNNNHLPEDSAFIYRRNDDGSEDRTTLVSYGGAKKDNPTIPSTVTTIGAYSFYDCKLTSVVLPNNVTTLEEDAFRGNPLTSLTLSESLVRIGDRAFNVNQLTTITIPASVKVIGVLAFEDNRLKNVIIKGKTSLSDFTSVGNGWLVYRLGSVPYPTITFEP